MSKLPEKGGGHSFSLLNLLQNQVAITEPFKDMLFLNSLNIIIMELQVTAVNNLSILYRLADVFFSRFIFWGAAVFRILLKEQVVCGKINYLKS